MPLFNRSSESIFNDRNYGLGRICERHRAGIVGDVELEHLDDIQAMRAVKDHRGSIRRRMEAVIRKTPLQARIIGGDVDLYDLRPQFFFRLKKQRVTELPA